MQEMVLMLTKKKSQKTGFSLITRTENDVFIIPFPPSKQNKTQTNKTKHPKPNRDSNLDFMHSLLFKFILYLFAYIPYKH